MSQQARETLVSRLYFQAASQKADLLSDTATKTELVALLLELTDKGHIIEITAVKSDHHDDSGLGEHCHFNGFAADCWPLGSHKAGDYLDVSSHSFVSFIEDAAHSQWNYQIGLTPDAYNSTTVAAAAGKSFQDDGGSHVHLGAV